MIHFLAPLLLLHRCIWPPTSPGHTLPRTVCFPTSPPLCMSYPIVVDDYPPHSALKHYPHAIIYQPSPVQYRFMLAPISLSVRMCFQYALLGMPYFLWQSKVHALCLVSELLRACREVILESPAKQHLCWGIPYPLHRRVSVLQQSLCHPFCVNHIPSLCVVAKQPLGSLHGSLCPLA